MLWLAPRAPLARPQRGSPRMFRVDWIEKNLSRVRPWHIIAVWTPIALYSFYRAVRVSPSPLSLIAMVALGVLVWTFCEYTLHRFVFHFTPNEKSEWQKDVSFIIHGVHHDYPWDADRLVMPPTVGLLLGAGIWLSVSVFAGVYTWACFTGVVMGYVWYDLTHYYSHHGRPKSRWAKWVRRNHMLHHFSTAHERYGITTPLWDVVFGTYPKHREHDAGQEDAAA